MIVTDLGSLNKTITIPQITWARIGAGNMYSVWWGYTVNYTTTPTNIFSINHDTGVVSNSGAATQAMIGRANRFTQHPVDNLMYLGVSRNTSSSADIGTFNFETGAYAKLHDGPQYYGTYDGSGDAAPTWSDEAHKRMFWAGNTVGGLWAWDPIDVSFQDYGPVDDPGSYRYRGIGSFQVTGTYAYCALSDSVAGKYLVIKNIITPPYNEVYKWKGSGLNDLSIHRGYDENVYIKLNNSDSQWYSTNGTNDPVLLGSPPSVYPALQRYYINYTGYNYDSANSMPDGLGNFNCLYNDTGSSTVFDTAVVAMQNLDDYACQASGIALNGNPNFFGLQYAPTVQVDVATDAKSYAHINNRSLFSLGQDSSRSLEFYGGYSTDSFKFDPVTYTITRVPLARTIDDPMVSRRIDNARYYYFCRKGSDGYIWYAAQFVRGTPEYESQPFVWLNPDDPTETGTGDIGWDVLQYYIYENVAMNLTGNKIVYSGVNKNSPYDSLLALASVSSKTITNYLTPISGGASQGRIVCVGGDNFVGITESTGTYKTYCVDVETEGLAWGPNTETGTTVFTNETSRYDPQFAYGFVWYYVGNDIVKLNPGTGNISIAVLNSEFNSQTGYSIYPGQLQWAGNTLYHFDRNTTHVFKITGLVSGYSRGYYISLPDDDTDLTTTYTDTEVTNVSLDDEVRVSQSVVSGNYAIHEFKNDCGSYNSVKLTWEGQTTTAPSASIVKLQIYNRTTPEWEDVATNNVANANEDFTLTGTVDISGTDYKDDNDMISCRVWQQAV